MPDPASSAARHDRVLIVDFGSQVTQLIARRLRETGVYCEIHPYNRADAAFIAAFDPKAIILSGGPASVAERASPRVDAAALSYGVPVLGICYGEQTICAQLGGRVESGAHREFGRAQLEIVEAGPLFDGVWEKGRRYPVWMSHGDRVVALPDGFRPIARSDGAPFAAIADERRRIWGVQFHPEVVHTPDGAKILSNFVRRIAGLKGDWTMASFREEEIARIRARVGRGRVVCGFIGRKLPVHPFASKSPMNWSWQL
ncbi:MAG: glutamine-hydrolyzing GMP synthase [Parvularculaceae bacterium]|nr:glutamine-hydrolyzing GMP synthase [Parvularculaceae bacterium]